MAEYTCDLLEEVEKIKDPRRQCLNLKHPLVNIILIGFCATLAGCDDFVEITYWARHNLDFFKSFLDLKNGIPSHDTFTRVFSLLTPDALQAVLIPWLEERRGRPGLFIHIDGKTMRGTRCDSKNLRALHVVSAWASEAGITLGQVAVDDKSNEITAIPELLKLLDLRGKIVTIDAMGCQQDIVEDIVEKGGDYVIPVKGNQPTLFEAVKEEFAKAEQSETKVKVSTSENTGHGRFERRTVMVLAATNLLFQFAMWLGLRSLVKVIREITNLTTGVTTTEVTYYISSLRPNAKRMSKAIRGHWSIENGLHWVLDVVFREDARKIQEKNSAMNLSFLNRLALSVLKEDSSDASMKVKRKRNGWGIDYIAKILGFSEK